jgi:hypothetical protein
MRRRSRRRLSSSHPRSPDRSTTCCAAGDRFARFIDDDRICLTNNAAERALRAFALGRKSWLFAGSERGGGHCPPEDCGGPWGYAELLEAIKDPTHKRHDELTEWIGDDFDPDADDAEWLTAEVDALAKKWSRTPTAKRSKRR